jgi:hypothetical protein
MKPAPDPISEEADSSTLPPILFKDSFYNIIPHSVKFSKRHLSFSYPYQNSVYIFLFSHACYI